MHPTLVARIVTADTIGKMCGPEPALGVFDQARDVVVADRIRVAAAVAKDIGGAAVEAREAVLRADPDETHAILQDGADRAVPKTFYDRIAFEIDAAAAECGLLARFPGKRDGIRGEDHDGQSDDARNEPVKHRRSPVRPSPRAAAASFRLRRGRGKHRVEAQQVGAWRSSDHQPRGSSQCIFSAANPPARLRDNTSSRTQHNEYGYLRCCGDRGGSC